ncbi:MAG TPA: sn-glycerol-3-phosphate ABC transporter ATP-binding protein UgpC [Jatrophihabitans sp.]|nr:sn-glycerol-3-phosphate ABC transporter ATP-binding protein UgpC [Jatrophihabitans sp.]
MAEVEYRKVTKRYPNGVVALKDFDLTIADGEFVILVGPSGCGKSTALRILAGLDKPTSGEVCIGGAAVTKQGPGERDIAMVFQNYALYPHMSVYKNLAYGLRQRKTPKDEIKKRVFEIGEILGITELLDRKPAQLSGGQRQRVAMGRALVREPQAFLLDEPLSNLDAKLRGQVRAELKRLHHRLGITSVYVTHDQVEAMTLADRICVMNQGELQQVGTPQDVYEHPANVFVAGFIGSPAMNLVPATVADGQVLLGGYPVGPAPHGYADVVVGIRPESLRIEPDGRPGIPVTVDFHEPLGSHALVHAFVGDASVGVVADHPAAVVVQADADISPHPGQRLTLTAEPKHIYLFDATTGAALSTDQRARVAASLTKPAQ